MVGRIRALAALALLAGSSSALAFTPESGFWLNPGEPGTGYNIEIQDDYLAIAAYAFRAEGPSVWFISAGPMRQQNGNPSNSLYNGVLDGYSGGQCIGCPYNGSGTVQPGAGGNISINFTTEATGTMTLGGRTFPIERLNFRLGDVTDRMLGEWQVTIDFYNDGSESSEDYPFFGDVWRIEGANHAASTPFFFGCRPRFSLDEECTNQSNEDHPLDGEFVPNRTDYNYVIDVIDVPPSAPGATITFTYFVTAGFTQFDGCVVVSDRPNVCHPVRGFRSASRTYVQTGNGPSSSDKAVVSRDRGISEILGVGFASGGLTREQAKARYGFDWVELLAQRDAQRAARGANTR